MSSILFEKKRANINGVGARLGTMLVGLCLSFFWQAQPFLQQQLAREALAVHPWLPAAVFSTGVLFGALLSIFFIRLGDWRRLTLMGGLLSAVCFAVAGFVPGETLLLIASAAAGLFAGLGLSAVVTCLGDTASPAGSFGGLLMLQGLLSVALQSSQPALLEALTFQYGLLAVAAVSLLAIPFSRLMPSSGTKRVSLLNDSGSGLSAELLTAHAGSALIFLAAGVLWYLSGPLADVRELSLGATPLLVLLLARAAGGLLAMLLGGRLGLSMPLGLGAVLLLAGLGSLQFLPGENGYLVGFSLIGGAGFLAAAYLMALSAQLDNSGRFAPLVLAVPLLGLMIGHLVAGKLAGGQSPLVLWSTVAALWLVGTLLSVWAARRS